MAPATLKSISRGEAPPFDAAAAKKECEIPSDQQTLLKSTPGWTNQKKTVRACARLRARSREPSRLFECSTRTDGQSTFFARGSSSLRLTTRLKSLMRASRSNRLRR